MEHTRWISKYIIGSAVIVQALSARIGWGCKAMSCMRNSSVHCLCHTQGLSQVYIETHEWTEVVSERNSAEMLYKRRQRTEVIRYVRHACCRVAAVCLVHARDTSWIYIERAIIVSTSIVFTQAFFAEAVVILCMSTPMSAEQWAVSVAPPSGCTRKYIESKSNNMLWSIPGGSPSIS